VKKAVVALALIIAVALAATPEQPRRTLTVTGTAEISVKPDICYVSFGVETLKKKSARDAYRTNAELMNALAAAVKAAGIPAKDIQTSSFSVTPQYRYEDNTHKRFFDGYRVYQQLDVNVRDLDKVSTVLDAGMDTGATQINSVTFAVENPKKYTVDARVEAVKAAQAKAQSMAELTGVKLGKPITISESEPGNYGRYYAQANVAMDAVAGGESSPNLEPGEFKLTRTVYITYEIE
jgi:uncharacterized protein YggE